MPRRLQTTLLTVALAAVAAPLARAERATGIDVSYWQGGDINWSQVAASGVDFAFIRATRGGTTGYYKSETDFGGSARYDDPYTARNVSGARANNLLAGVYHYARIDLINHTDPDYPGYAGNTGLDEANHFLESAAQYMKPGYLRPVVDVEAGDIETSPEQLTNWVMQFSNRILAATGVRPIVYINSNYAKNEVTSAINVHDLWLARYVYRSVDNPTQATRDAWAAQVQTIAPPTPSGYPDPYGVFKTAGNPVPWDFWQYTDGGRTPGIVGNVDQDVFNGDVEALKEFLVPALWMANANGNWSTLANWNGALPTANDRTILDRTSGNYLVTITAGNHNIRSLVSNERLAVDGGSLAAVQHLTLNNTFTQTLGSVSAATITNNATMNLTGGATTATSGFANPGTLNILAAASLAAPALTNTGTIAMGTTGGTPQLVVAGAITGGGAINVKAGTLRAGSITGGSTLSVSGPTSTLEVDTLSANALTVDAGATYHAGRFTLNTLNVAGDSRVMMDRPTSDLSASVTRTLSVGTGGQLDIVDDAVIVDWASVSPAAALRSAVQSGRASGTWDGPGIISSLVAASNGSMSVALIESTALFSDFANARFRGVALDNTSLILVAARSGDTNLDGSVNFADLLTLAKQYNSAGTWRTGDLDYSGDVGFGDLLLLARNYNTSGANPRDLPTGSAGFAADWALAQSLVPEPSALAALSLLGALTRRRRPA